MLESSEKSKSVHTWTWNAHMRSTTPEYAEEHESDMGSPFLFLFDVLADVCKCAGRWVYRKPAQKTVWNRIDLVCEFLKPVNRKKMWWMTSNWKVQSCTNHGNAGTNKRQCDVPRRRKLEILTQYTSSAHPQNINQKRRRTSFQKGTNNALKMWTANS